MKVYVIVVTYNGEKWIESCFGSLQQSELKVHTIAIDNASTDRTVSLLKSNYPEVEIIENVKNMGFGRANNQGFQRALDDNADYVFLLNQDAWIQPDTVGSLLTAQRANTEYDILSPLHFDIENQELIDPNCAIEFSLEFISETIQKKKLKEVYEIKGIHAAIWFMTTRAIKRVGGFDPIFFYQSEDVDYINRYKNLGYKFGLVPNSKAYHRGYSKRNETLRFQTQINFLSNKELIYFKKHLNEPFFKLLYFSLTEIFFDSLKYMFRFKCKKSFIYMLVLVKILFLIPAIYRSRKNTLKKTCPFLLSK